MEDIEGSAVGPMAGVLEDFIGCTNVTMDDLQPDREEEFAAADGTYHRK